MNTNKIFFCGLFLFTAITAFAYDAVGHRVVADIAYHNLNEKSRTKVDALLGKRGMIYAATWADEIRSDNRYAYSYPWHYQDLDDAMSAADLKKLVENPTAEGEHLFYAIDLMTARLKKNNNDVEALRFLIHFMGDLHQPLHLGRKTDKGGNEVEYKWFGKKINLHSLWDDYLIENRRMSYSEYSQYLQDKFESQKSGFRAATLLQSIGAVYEVRNRIYAYDYTDTNNYHYAYAFSDKLDEMLYRGGIQLANLLNDIYK